MDRVSICNTACQSSRIPDSDGMVYNPPSGARPCKTASAAVAWSLAFLVL